MKMMAALSVLVLSGCANMPTREARLASGSASDNYTLSSIYASGIGVEKNLQKSFEYLEKAANRGDKGGQYTLAIKHDRAGRYQKAISWYEKASSDGINRHAIHRLAEIYDQGLLGEPDKEKALHYYLITAKAGYLSSACRVSEMYLEKGNHKLAFIWAGFAMQGNEYAARARTLKDLASFEMPPLEALELERQVSRYIRIYSR